MRALLGSEDVLGLHTRRLDPANRSLRGRERALGGKGPARVCDGPGGGNSAEEIQSEEPGKRVVKPGRTVTSGSLHHSASWGRCVCSANSSENGRAETDLRLRSHVGGGDCEEPLTPDLGVRNAFCHVYSNR